MDRNSDTHSIESRDSNYTYSGDFTDNETSEQEEHVDNDSIHGVGISSRGPDVGIISSEHAQNAARNNDFDYVTMDTNRRLVTEAQPNVSESREDGTSDP